MFILAILVGIAQEEIYYLRYLPKETAKVLKNPYASGVPFVISSLTVVLLSIIALIYLTFGSFSSEDINWYISARYVIVGLLWTIFVEAIYVTIRVKLLIK